MMGNNVVVVIVNFHQNCDEGNIANHQTCDAGSEIEVLSADD